MVERGPGVKTYLTFLERCFRLSFVGDARYYAWMFLLTVFVLLGIKRVLQAAGARLATTGMTTRCRGVLHRHFTFLVGMAAAAVMLVIPVYIYRNRELHDLVIFGSSSRWRRSSWRCSLSR